MVVILVPLILVIMAHYCGYGWHWHCCRPRYLGCGVYGPCYISHEHRFSRIFFF